MLPSSRNSRASAVGSDSPTSMPPPGRYHRPYSCALREIRGRAVDYHAAHAECDAAGDAPMEIQGPSHHYIIHKDQKIAHEEQTPGKRCWALSVSWNLAVDFWGGRLDRSLRKKRSKTLLLCAFRLAWGPSSKSQRTAISRSVMRAFAMVRLH